MVILSDDAAPVPLRDLGRSLGVEMPRLASRFAELAVIGARLCLNEAEPAPPTSTRVYLATGLGDVARTDALYYEVMPPKSELPSPAYFATSGNNIAGFFVAQQAGFVSRNLTVSLAELSLERALMLAGSDLMAGACSHALVGAVDETTAPREFYVRRFPLAHDRVFGEGSAWMLLSATPGPNAIGTINDVQMIAAQPVDSNWATHIADYARTHNITTLMPGCGIGADGRALLQQSLAPWPLREYLPMSGCYPTAVGLGMNAWVRSRDGDNGGASAPGNNRALFINRDARGRTALVIVARGC